MLGSQVEEAAAAGGAAAEGVGEHEVSVSPAAAAAMPRSPQGAGAEAIPGGADLQTRPRGRAAGPDAGCEPGQIHPPSGLAADWVGGSQGGGRPEKGRFVTGEARRRKGRGGASASFHLLVQGQGCGRQIGRAHV